MDIGSYIKHCFLCLYSISISVGVANQIQMTVPFLSNLKILSNLGILSKIGIFMKPWNFITFPTILLVIASIDHIEF